MTNDIVIISSNPEDIFEDIKELYKKETLKTYGKEKTLEQSEPRWLDYNVLTVLVSNVKAEMNDAAKQNFIRYARGERLDLKGEFYGERGVRQTAEKAKTTMQCYIQQIKNRDVIIKAGTRFIKDEYLFQSTEEYKILAGQLSVNVPIEATQAGYVPIYGIGEITEIVDLYDFYDHCSNITEVLGGVNDLDDEDYKEKLQEIPETYSTAGPSGSYEYYTKQTSSLIVDVYVVNPNPNYIDVYVVGENGINISQEIKDSVLKVLSQNDIRPMGDIITIKDPIPYNYSIDFTYYISKENETKALEISNNLNLGIENYKIEMVKMGQAINPQDIIAIAKGVGCKRINLREPASYVNIPATNIPICTATSIVDGGIE